MSRPGRIAIGAVAAATALLGMAGCGSKSGDTTSSKPSAEPFPTCQSLVSHLPADALTAPAVRFAQSPGDGQAATTTSLCPVTGVAADGKTPLQVQIWLSRPSSGTNAQALGDLAKARTADYCDPTAPSATGSPITSSRCYAHTVAGRVAGLAVVHGAVIIGVRIDSDGIPSHDTAFQQMLQSEAEKIASAVAGTL